MSDSKERVLKVYPDARCVEGVTRVEVISPSYRGRIALCLWDMARLRMERYVLGVGQAESIAWANAAAFIDTKLPQPAPPSPAGEIASEDEYDTPERIAALVQQAEKECTGKPDDWRDFIAELSQLAPEAAAALCEDEGCPHYGTAHICVSKTKLDELRRIIREQEDFINAQEEELNERPAPIAPAAAPDEVIEKLVDALNGVRMWMHVNVPRDVVDSIVNALACAESYRKESEAKNG